MSRISFNVAAKCDKAGRSQNQDNYWVCPDLDKVGRPAETGDDHEYELSDKGALLVVADGMGGMKSGEKASEFVIEGIRRRFSAIPAGVLHNDASILSFIRTAINEADQLIKDYAKTHRESEGMGSTIVLLWMLGEKAYCGWCGDSRIYCYNPQNSLVRLSHDHSYVQGLVDEGKITEEEAFEHPDSNIITRSLGDNGEKAEPETKVYPVHRRDVFLLCSDGLCGLLDDKRMESIIGDDCTSSADILRNLWKAGEAEGWTDNATIEVACVTDGGATPTRKAEGYDTGRPKPVVNRPGAAAGSAGKTAGVQDKKKGVSLLYLGIALAAIIIGGVFWFVTSGSKSKNDKGREYNVEFSNDESTPQDDAGDDNVFIPSGGSGQENQATRRDDPRRQNRNDRQNQTVAPGRQPAQNEPAVTTVSEEYLNVLKNTFQSMGSVEAAISHNPLSNEDVKVLTNFISYANSLSSKPEAKLLNDAQKSVLNRINALKGQAQKALKRPRTNNHPTAPTGNDPIQSGDPV